MSMKYKTGMFGGSFDPLHTGHIHDIIRAAAMCRELYVVISWCRGRESTSKEMRYRWILNSTRHLPNVMIRMVEDQALTKEEYDTPGYWEQGARDIKAVIGKPIDAVFCGTDYLGTGRFEALYGPESQVIYFDRSEVPVCSTDIRAWALGHWDYIPSVCRDYYARRVLVLGSESTGKSTLVGSWRTLRPASLSLPLSIRQKNYYYDTTGKDEREGRKWWNRERAKETAVKNRA